MGSTMISELDTSGQISGSSSNIWNSRLALLHAYAEREGHCLVPEKHVEANFKLGKWVLKQRTAYQNGLLTDERIAALTAIPGWAWNAPDALWGERFKLLEEYIAIHSTLPSRLTSFRGVKLGVWVGVQRQSFRKGKLAADREQLLANLPEWKWRGETSDPSVWGSRLALLHTFAAREGHCSVPARHVEANIQLGNWVVAQRQAYRNGLLSEERVAALTAIPNWAWATRESLWDERFTLLEDYLKNHSILPSVKTEVRGVQLGIWLRDQRQAFHEGSLASDRAERLANLPGWTWRGKRGRPPKKNGELAQQQSQVAVADRRLVASTQAAKFYASEVRTTAPTP